MTINYTVNLKKDREFTEEHLKIYTNYHKHATWDVMPEFYGTIAEEKYGLKFIGAELIDLDKIDPDMNENTKEQSDVRFGRNDRYEDIKESIIQGWNLLERSVSVVKLSDDSKFTHKITEGRNRFSIIRAMGVKNLIVEVYEQVNNNAPSTVRDFSFRANKKQSPKGAFTLTDLQGYITAQFTSEQMKDLKSDKLSGNAIREHTNKIIERIGDINLKGSDIRKIVKGIQNSHGVLPYESLNKSDTQKRLSEINKKDKKYYYLAIGNDTNSIYKEGTKFELNLPPEAEGKKIRLVASKADFSIDNPEDEYIDLLGYFQVIPKNYEIFQEFMERCEPGVAFYSQLREMQDVPGYEKDKIIFKKPSVNIQKDLEKRRKKAGLI